MQPHPVAFSRFFLLLLLLIVALLPIAPVHAQAPPLGSWSTGFDHTTTPAALNDFLAPFQGQPGYEAPPASQFGSFGFYFSSGNYPPTVGNYQPIHMALIPKGPHRGKVLIWDEWPVVLKPGTTLDPQDRYWACQSWSIVDPVTRQFRNYLLPLRPTLGLTQNPIPIESVVCAGHAWSQEGDLVVAGGSAADVDPITTPFGYGNLSNAAAAKFLFLFDPAALSQPFPGQPPTSSLYVGEVGWWGKVPVSDELLVGRWYPTVTLSQTLTRIPPSGGEVVVVSGGTTTFSPMDPTLNTYESYVVRHSTVLLPAAFLSRDPDHSVNPPAPTVLPGPLPTTATPTDERLDLYPRLHLLTNGRMFLSGYAPLSSAIDLDVPLLQPPGPRTWDQNVGRNWTAWPYTRIDGASVFFARVGALQDVVVRLGGARLVATNTFIATDTAEYCIATVPNAPWSSLPVMPGGPRWKFNAVVLPDASVLVLGGSDSSGTQVYTTALYRQGIGWQTPKDSPARRKYHATAVLLPDGRVLVGGGDDRQATDSDFHVFSPHYLEGNPLRPVIAALTDPGGLPTPMDPLDGTWLLQGSLSGYRLDCDVADFDSVAKVVLIAPGSLTHHSDMTARYVELPSSSVSSTSRLFSTPDSRTLPRGYYMMFALNSGNIPSEAAWVKIQ